MFLSWNETYKYNQKEITSPIWYVGQDFYLMVLEKYFQMKLQIVYLYNETYIPISYYCLII